MIAVTFALVFFARAETFKLLQFCADTDRLGKAGPGAAGGTVPPTGTCSESLLSNLHFHICGDYSNLTV